jgi:ribonucleoside-triphosphate reductase
MKIIKRNGAEVTFDITKIIMAITRANDTVAEGDRLTPVQIQRIAENVALQCEKMNRAATVEEIQDMVEHHIMAHGAFEVAKHYITYRYTRSLVRKSNTTDDKILSLIECNNEEAKQENSNKNPVVNSTQRDYMAGEVSRDITERLLLPQDIVEAHREGLIHFHDADYFAQHMHNCDLVNLEDMLQNGTVITGTLIEKPHSFATACNIATQIVAQVASNQYGGQSISLTHLAPFVDVSRQKLRATVREEFDAIGVSVSTDQINAVAEKRLREEIRRGVQTIQYQVVTLLTTNGQAPFITVFMYLGEARNQQERNDLAMIIEEMLLQRIEGVKNEKGVWITPAFPKLIYVLEEDNVTEGSRYWYLTKLAAKCTAKRMVPDYISEKKMLELKVDKNGEGHCYTCMGCRSFLTPYVDENGQPKYYGRFNQGVVTVNLPDIALSSGGNIEKFWKIFDERMELCHRALMCRHERLKGTLSDAAPILWQYGALARLKKGEPIDKLLYGGYSTISLGYAGLYECVKYMTGKSHTDPSATPFALEIMNRLNAACKGWKAKHNIDFSLYGTPLESTTYKFAKCLQKRFGVIEGITDKGYITNSYHVHVTEKIDAFKKLEFEAQFQHLSPGGAISYVEVPDMQNNIDAVLSVMQFIYDHIIYAELNTKSDYCQVCGWDGEIDIEDVDGKLIWKCPQCGNTDQDKMNVARRTCGYIGTQFWNQGRTQEIKERVLHVS